MRVQVLRAAGEEAAAERLTRFADMLLRLGNGDSSEDGHWEAATQLPQQMIFAGTEMEFVAHVFEGYREEMSHPEKIDFLSSRCILAPTNRIATRLNNLIVDEHVVGSPSDEVHKLRSVDAVQEEDQQGDYPEELLHTLEVSGLLPHHL